MDLSGQVRPADRLVAAYNAFQAVLWAALLPRAHFAAGVLAAHAAAVALPWLWARAPRPARPLRVLKEIYPLLWLAAFWVELDLLRGLSELPSNDGAILRLDMALFGRHLHAEWMPRMSALWWSEAMHFAYYAYYPLIAIPPLYALIAGRTAALQDITFRLMVTYVACYFWYIAFPVDGPWRTRDLYAGALSEGLFYGLVRDALEMGASRGAAFPSSHVAGAVTIALLGWRWFSRPAAVLLTVEALGVVLSTIYTQNHYAIDSLAGIVWGLALQLAAVPALARALGPRPARRPVPVLPRPAPWPARRATEGDPCAASR